MSINLKGHILNQRQLDAIVPVMNDLMQGKVSQKKFESACIKALEQAGCPVGYDTAIPGAESTVAERAQGWILNGQVGMSAKAIYCQMTGNTDKDRWNYPHDPDDLNRCLLLLDLIPEWKPRMIEMAQRGPAWKGLAENWESISATFIDEVGLDWCKARSAPKTYDLMQAAIDGHEEPGVFRVRA
jgi:hypothetical protein